MSETPDNLFAIKQLSQYYDSLAPDGSEIRLLGTVNGGGMAHCILPVGKTSKAVKHQTVEEIWFFTAGRGQVWRKLLDYEQVIDIYPGLSLTIPLGTSFQFRSIGNEPLTFIITTVPRWPGPQEAIAVENYWEEH
jgi:mannose-6-phosphate isomerase-like protein (cupin superfamily)